MANPNPSPETRFKPGESGNRAGRSTEEQKNHNEAARIASELKLRALSCLQETARGKEGMALIGLLMNADAVRLFKEVEDRAHGTPKQAIMHGNDPDNPMPNVIRIEAALVDSDDPHST